jgi:hypothetical protein
MLDYATLDLIADAHNPLVLLVALLGAAAPAAGRNWRLAGARLGALALLVALVYLLRWLDRLLDPANAWPAGYSTHSALALVAAACVAAFLPRLRWPAAALLLAYLTLVRWQGYHSVADIALSLVLLAPACWLILRRLVPGPAAAAPPPAAPAPPHHTTR